MKSAITISLVEEARGGPFVLWDGLEAGCAMAAELGFDAVELFLPGPDAVAQDELEAIVRRHQLRVAAVGTGAGMVKHGLSMVDPDLAQREKAVAFIKSMIDFGGYFSAPAIIGSMQGRWGAEVSRDQALEWLSASLKSLGAAADAHGIPLIYEPLNRYETNLFNTTPSAARWLEAEGIENVVVLADLFHMNIEEADIGEAIRQGGKLVGHIHFADSNRHAVGFGHTEYDSIVAAIKEIGYGGYISAEVFPLPDSRTAAEKTIESYQKYFGR